MKKILALNTLALFVASAAFAGGNVDFSDDLAAAGAKTGLTLYGAKTAGAAATAGPDQKVISKTSTGVGLAVLSDAAGYAVMTQHKNGTKAYGTSHDSTAIYVKDVTKGTATDNPENANSTDFVTSGNGWTTM